jgi:hypothetical protein
VTAATVPTAAVRSAAVATRVSASRAAWLLGAAGVSLVLTVRQLADPDVWWHLALGRLISAQGIPSTEPFTFAGAASPWIGQQWLYEVGLHRLVDGPGAGAAMLVMGLVAAAALVVAALAVRPGTPVRAGALGGSILLSAVVAGELLGVRGQVVSVLGCALTLLLLTRWRAGSSRAPWLLVPLVAVWANLHAGFLVAGLGLALLAAATVAIWQRLEPGAVPAARPRRLLLAIAVAALAAMLNPAGPHLYGYVLTTFLNPTLTQGITEWQSPDFHLWGLRLFELQVVGLVVLWALHRRPDPLDVVLALGTVVASLQAQRNVALFAVIALPQVAVYGSAAWERLLGSGRVRPRRRRASVPGWFAPALAALVVAGVVVVDVLPSLRSSVTQDYVARHEPVAAADYVAAHLAGQRLYSTYEWGGYLAARFPDSRVVYIYGESAIFGKDRLNEYLRIHLVEKGWQDVLASRGMRHAVVPALSQETSAFEELGWTPLCHDPRSGAVVLQAPAVASPGVSTTDPPVDATTAAAC